MGRERGREGEGEGREKGVRERDGEGEKERKIEVEEKGEGREREMERERERERERDGDRERYLNSISDVRTTLLISFIHALCQFINISVVLSIIFIIAVCVKIRKNVCTGRCMCIRNGNEWCFSPRLFTLRLYWAGDNLGPPTPQYSACNRSWGWGGVGTDWGFVVGKGDTQ